MEKNGDIGRSLSGNVYFGCTVSVFFLIVMLMLYTEKLCHNNTKKTNFQNIKKDPSGIQKYFIFLAKKLANQQVTSFLAKVSMIDFCVEQIDIILELVDVTHPIYSVGRQVIFGKSVCKFGSSSNIDIFIMCIMYLYNLVIISCKCMFSLWHVFHAIILVESTTLRDPELYCICRTYIQQLLVMPLLATGSTNGKSLLIFLDQGRVDPGHPKKAQSGKKPNPSKIRTRVTWFKDEQYKLPTSQR